MSDADLPSPPWTLRGHGLLVLRWLPVADVQRRLPAGIRLVPLLPGRTLAALFCGHYGQGSTLQYSEMIFSPGLARVRGRLGWWVGDICVDAPLAQQGGHRIWGLPKYCARFDWDAGNGSVNVESQELEQVLSLSVRPARTRMGPRLPLLAPALAGASMAGRGFWARGSARVRMTKGLLRAQPGEALQWPARVRVLLLDDLALTISAPGL